MTLSTKVRVAVLRGGPSTNYQDSLKTGEHVLSVLREMPDYHPIDIFISKDGEWHRGGVVEDPHRILRFADVAWNALHGSYGEDGQIQRLLESLQVPFTGSSTIPSMLSLHKDASKKIYDGEAFLTPRHELLTRDNLSADKFIEIFQNFLHPVIVKPANMSGSIGISRAHSYNELRNSIERTFEHSPRVMVEEFVNGDEVSCAVIEGAKGERLYALLPVSKSETQLRMEDSDKIQNIAKRAHSALGLRHYSSSDFIVTPKKKIYILETNSAPVLQADSLTDRALRATGWRSQDFVDHVLKLALK